MSRYTLMVIALRCLRYILLIFADAIDLRHDALCFFFFCHTPALMPALRHAVCYGALTPLLRLRH